MDYGKGYRNWEEFEREEIRRHERLEMSFEEILSEFDNDESYLRRKRGRGQERQGLFDFYEDGESSMDEYEN